MLLLSLMAAFSLSLHPPLQVQNNAPASLEILFEGISEYGGGWDLTIILQAQEDLKKAEIWVEKSNGLSLRRGSLFWHRKSLKSREEAVIQLSFSLIGPIPQDITVNLVGYTTGGKRFEQQARRSIAYSINKL